MSSIGFAALLCSRLCHDLVSPVGALSNGVEILAEETDEDMREQVIQLLEQSARQTSNRLQFFRLAFGAAGGFGARIDPREGEKAITAFFAGSKVALDWRLDMPSIDKDAMKLLLNLALLAGEGLIRGGTLVIGNSGAEEAEEIVIAADGERYLFSDTARAALAGDIDESALEPRTAPAYLAGIVAREIGAQVEALGGDGRNGFRARL